MAAKTDLSGLRIAVNGWFLGQPGTGSGQYLRGLLRAWPGVAADHRLLLAVPGGRIELNVPGLEVEFWSSPARLWRTNLGKVLFEQVTFPWLCRRYGADVAHVPYWGSPLRPTVPTVVTVHDLIPLLLPAYRGGPAVRAYTRLVAASARRAAAVLTDSQASQRDIEQHLKLPAGRVRCVYLAAGECFSPEQAPDDEAIRKRYDLPPRYVLYLAGHDVRKNVAGLAQAFAVVSKADDDVDLVIGGSLPEPVKRRSALQGPSPLADPRPLIDSLGIADRVHLVGWVDEAHAPALYRGAACAVFPSRYEGFGLPVLEALACGTPLVTSNTSSLPELLGDAGFAIDPDDIQGLAGAILSCLLDESLASELRRRGPVQAARFCWMQAARETVAVYEEIGTRNQAAVSDTRSEGNR